MGPLAEPQPELWGCLGWLGRAHLDEIRARFFFFFCLLGGGDLDLSPRKAGGLAPSGRTPVARTIMPQNVLAISETPLWRHPQKQGTAQ